MPLRVWIWLLSLSVLWGGSFFFAKVAVGELPPLDVVFGARRRWPRSCSTSSSSRAPKPFHAIRSLGRRS